jgi:hypothetical protein
MKKGAVIAIFCMLLAIPSLVLSCYVPSIPSPSIPGSTPATEQVVITYSSMTMRQIGFASQPSPGHVYLVLDMTVENQGYASFKLNPVYFAVVIDNMKYGIAFVVELDGVLASATLLNGDKVEGNLAFEIPEEASTADFQVIYQSLTPHYNIEWVEK